MQDILNSIEFSLLDMIDDNIIQVLSGLDAYDDNNYYGNIDDTTPKVSILSKVHHTMMNSEYFINVYKRLMNISNESFIRTLFYNEEMLDNAYDEAPPFDNKLFYKEDLDQSIANSNSTLTGEYERIIAFGDIHGDYKKLIKVLTAAKLIDERKNWIAKNTALVQVGDLIDRDYDSKKILNLMIKLKKQAPSYGSKVYLIIGNHEAMNIGGRYDYLTVTEILNYGNIYLREKKFSFHENFGYLIRMEMNATAIVGDTLFVHAGILPYHLDGMTLDDINNHFRTILVNAPTHPSELSDMYSQPVFTDKYFGDEGPIWTRVLSDYPQDRICEELYKALNMTNTKRMVVGHTVQQNGQINTRCNDHIYFVDVGMSRAYFNTMAYLEFKKDGNEIWAKYN